MTNNFSQGEHMNKLLQYMTECDEVPTTEITILEEDIQDAVDDSEQAGEVVDQAFQEIQSANDAIDSLYRVAGVIKDSVTDSTDTTTVRALTEIAIEQIYDSINVKMPQSLAMEADFLEGAKAAANKIKEHAVRIMAAIIEAFRKAVEWIGDYFKKVTSAAGRLESKVKSLNKRLGQVRGNPKNASFKDIGLARALSKGDDLIKRYKELSDLTEDAAKVAWSGEHVTLLNQIIEEFAKAELKDVTPVLKLVLRIPEVLEKTYGNIFKHGDELVKISDVYAREGTEVHTTSFLPGGYVGIMTTPDSLDTLRHLSFVIRRDEESVSSDAGDGVMKTLSLSDIKALLTIAMNISSEVQAYQDFESKLKSIPVKLTRAAEALKKTPAEMDKGHREILGAIAIMAPYIVRGIHGRVFGFATSCTNSILNYCEKSISEYEQ
jgi:hypothetical protein